MISSRLNRTILFGTPAESRNSCALNGGIARANSLVVFRGSMHPA
jgi:hypothetical protein